MQATVPNSSGTAPPRLAAPPGACDAHIHVLDPGATIADYRLLQARIGTTRAIVVQPKVYGTDNACTLDAIARLGIASARGIAVVHPNVSDAELARLDAGGISGLRFSVWNPADTITSIAMIEPLSTRIAALGWHVQLHMSADQIVDNAALLDRIPAPIVFDHVGRLPPQTGIAHPAFAIIRRLLDSGRAWMKLSGAYLNTRSGPPAYADASAIARAFAQAAPQRMVWGSDWPHVTEREKPDDAVLFDLLADWVPDAVDRRRVLVDNPATLYGFA
jgi:D-galactarolactone isomerase